MCTRLYHVESGKGGAKKCSASHVSWFRIVLLLQLWLEHSCCPCHWALVNMVWNEDMVNDRELWAPYIVCTYKITQVSISTVLINLSSHHSQKKGGIELTWSTELCNTEGDQSCFQELWPCTNRSCGTHSDNLQRGSGLNWLWVHLKWLMKINRNDNYIVIQDIRYSTV